MSNDMRIAVTGGFNNGMKMVNANGVYMIGLYAQRNDIGGGTRQRGISNIQSTSSQNLYGFPFNFFIENSPTSNTQEQTEAFRFWTYTGLDGAGTTNTKRFYIGNGASVSSSAFINSQLGLTDGASITVDSTALLDLQSTTRGFLPPRMTTAERDLIGTPATGLTIFNTDNNTINQRTSSAWVDLVSSSNYDGLNIAFGTTNGTKIGTSTTQKIGFWNATPIVQPTTAVAAAAFVSNTSLIFDDTATFDGYTIGQIVKALRNTGILA
jgi:hypothetical protein